MVSFIPWRLKKLIADNLPELYHILNNLDKNPNSLAQWDNKLEKTWDSELWSWPDKNRLLSTLIDDKNNTVIDIGCGNGSILRYLRKNGYNNLHGLELSKYAIDRLTQEGFIMHHSKLPSINLADSSFDFVIASEVLEHILRRHTLIKELKRILKPTGKLVIFVPDDCQGPMDEKEHVRQYNATTLRFFLDKYFKSVNVQSFKDSNHTTQFLFALCSNY